MSKVVKIGLYLCAQKLSENIPKKVDINLEIIKRLFTFVGIKKSETRKPRFKCFHNGIILIVSSIKFYGAKIDTFSETTKQNLIKFSIKAITF